MELPPESVGQENVSGSLPWMFRLKWNALGKPLLIVMTRDGFAAMAGKALEISRDTSSTDSVIIVIFFIRLSSPSILLLE